MGAGDKREVTPGITELSSARVHIDPRVCYFDVVCSYPGAEQGAKGGSLDLAFASASLVVRNTVKLAFALTLYGGFLTLLSQPLGAPV